MWSWKNKPKLFRSPPYLTVKNKKADLGIYYKSVGICGRKKDKIF